MRPNSSRLRPPHRATATLSIVAIVSILASCSSAGSDDQGVCMPGDPRVSPTSAPPGATVTVDVDGFLSTTDCDPMPNGATYTIEIRGKGQSDWVEVGSAKPDSSGIAKAAVTVPRDIEKGDAALRITVEGATLDCELDEASVCGNMWTSLSLAAD